jgi:hypothetical protein
MLGVILCDFFQAPYLSAFVQLKRLQFETFIRQFNFCPTFCTLFFNKPPTRARHPQQPLHVA